MRQAVFAIPGDKDRRTGGFIYEATVLRVLNEIGCATRHLVLPDSFPDPTPQDMDITLAALRAVPKGMPIILDGLVFGSIDPRGLATVEAPVIAMIHHPLALETGLSAKRAAFLHANEAEALRHTAHVIVPSPHTAGILMRDYAVDLARITIAPPGFARLVLAPAPIDPPLILSVGLLATRKGHDVLIAALATLQDLDWQAEIVGKPHDPAYADALQAQVRTRGLNDRVRFLGEISERALAERYNAARIFALATRYEGYGMVLSEAMQYGLAIVSCAAGAVPDTVGAAGVLVPANDPSAFGHALRGLLTDPAQLAHYQAAARGHAAGLPTWQDTATHFSDVVNRYAR
jgi:glycosyltransferase involved in cell wall biosynthesis